MSPGLVTMEDGKLLKTLNRMSPEEDSMEDRLIQFCQAGLSLDEETSKQALRLFRESKHVLLANMGSLGSGRPDENERFWFASVLYSVKRLNGGNSVGKGNQDDNDTGFTLSQILRVAKLNVVEFFKEMPQFFLKAGSILNNLYGNDWEKRLQAQELQANFVHLTVLNKYYKRVYQDFFCSRESSEDKSLSTVSNGAGPAANYFRFGWMLFLALRIHVFSRFKDLVTCTNGLVSILAILILHVPVHFRNFSLDDSARFVRKCGKGVDLVSSLCNIYHTSEDDLLKTIDKANSLIVDILQKCPRLASECQAEELKDIDTDGLTYFEGLMDESSLALSTRILEKDYENAIHDRGELDERMFVNEEDSLFGSASMSGGPVNVSGVKRKYDAISSPTKTITSPSSPPGSPLASSAKESSAPCSAKMLPPTPVSTTMTTAKWLRTVITPLPANPSSELERFLASCDRNITEDVMHRAQIILEAIFPCSSPGDLCVAGSLQSAALMDSIWAEQRRKEASKLYYRVLAAMCRAESQRLRTSNLTSLLTNERFHRCMLACSAELVLATHKTVTMMFPAVLERTGITAFDLSKVIESFVRHEETLPRELKRHLNSLEERLLESMAWEKGSSMYNSLIVARPSLSAEINRLGLLADPMPSLDTIAMHHNLPSGGFQLSSTPHRTEGASDQNTVPLSFPERAVTTTPVLSNDVAVVVSGEHSSLVSPMKERLSAFSTCAAKSRSQPPLQSAFASPTRPSSAGGSETCAETGINVFFQKVLKLAAIRIKSLCERLEQSNTFMEQVYRLVKHMISHETSLFFNRHIDQLILSGIYGISKVSDLKLTFRGIISSYRKQPQCKPQVFRNVFVDWSSTKRCGKSGQETVDIITFYNEVFIPVVKPFLVQLGPSGASVKHNHGCEDTNKSDGPSPGSPESSPFPNLPDMSPKKVSATHNVYVSPLRSSKMETLISQHSKSLYACVGESTHAYQSPSKDLTAINNRLNSRRVSGRLNFDDAGLVSDSLVARSLYPSQNSGHLTSDSVLSQSQSLSWPNSASPLKRKQSDR